MIDDSVTVTLSYTGSLAAITQLLAAMPQLGDGEVSAATRVPAATPAKDDREEPYAGPNSGVPVSLDGKQFEAFYRDMDPLYQKGVRLLAARGGTISCDDLIAKGIGNPGHFKSRTSLRARTVLGLNRRVQFATYFSKVVKGHRRWYLRVPPGTLASMKAHFAM
ncbi:MAG: hypothetical protein QOD42_2967 [Sphingomonadales bacterium]|jgi:hypothetical protein|nr:hypothetical protein [Sphingomonadales bacterium]